MSKFDKLCEEILNEGKLSKGRDAVETGFLKLFKDVYTITNSGLIEYHLSNPYKSHKHYSGDLIVVKNRDGSYLFYGERIEGTELLSKVEGALK